MVEDVGAMQEFCEVVKHQFGDVLKDNGGVEQFLQNVLGPSQQAVPFFQWLLHSWPTNAEVLYLPLSDHRDLAQALTRSRAACCRGAVASCQCCLHMAALGWGESCSARGHTDNEVAGIVGRDFEGVGPDGGRANVFAWAASVCGECLGLGWQLLRSGTRLSCRAPPASARAPSGTTSARPDPAFSSPAVHHQPAGL